MHVAISHHFSIDEQPHIPQSHLAGQRLAHRRGSTGRDVSVGPDGASRVGAEVGELVLRSRHKMSNLSNNSSSQLTSNHQTKNTNVHTHILYLILPVLRTVQQTHSLLRELTARPLVEVRSRLSGLWLIVIFFVITVQIALGAWRSGLLG